jgi:hypothetical protein
LEDPAAIEFDASPYVRAPRGSVPAIVGLSIKLLSAVPTHPPPGVRAAARRLRRATVALQERWAERERAPKPATLRPFDIIDDNAWSALRGRIADYARLPVATFPKAARAAEIHDSLFPNLGFLNLEYATQWSECEMRLKRIDAEGLAAEIDEIAGPEFLANVRAAHKQYGDALGITRRATEETEVPNLARPLRAVCEAIAHYAVQVVAMRDPDQDADGAMLRTIRTALKPLDEYREKTSRAGGTEPEPARPDTPVPNPA